jgi:TatD DNase family protein
MFTSKDPRPYIDTHFHLDLYPSPEQTARQIEDKKVYTIAVTNTPSVFKHTKALTEELKFVRPALGLHPELASERADELGLMLELLPKTRYVGEIGLDYASSSQENKKIQRQVFEKILDKCSSEGGKVLTIHSRQAAQDVVNMLQGFNGTPILHWYSGSKKTLEQALSNGCYFSVNPNMARTKKFERVLSWIPKERLLTETDGPFVEVSERPAEPNDTALVVKQISRVWGVSTRVVREKIFSNFKRLLQETQEKYYA